VNSRFLRRTALALGLLCLPVAVHAVQVTGRAELQFTGTSTLHDFSGAATSLPLTLEADTDTPTGAQAWRADVDVPVASMDTGNRRRDDSMREMLHSSQCPLLRGAFRNIDPQAVRRSGQLPFVLTICDVAHPVSATIRDWQQEEGRLTFTAEFVVSLQSFNLVAPRVLFIQVGDTVHVTTRVTLEGK